jgi:transglutaminase-like putative cysteine protease
MQGLAAVGYFGSIPGGIDGVRATLRIMVKVARSFLRPDAHNADRTAALLTVRTLAQNVVQDCAEKDYWCEADKLHAFVTYKIRYLRDMRTAETVQFPDQTLLRKSGDCDDKALLYCCLAECIGFPSRLCAIGVQGEDFSHVSAQVMIPKMGWVNAETIPIDDQGTHAALGWTPPDATSFMIAHI